MSNTASDMIQRQLLGGVWHKIVVGIQAQVALTKPVKIQRTNDEEAPKGDAQAPPLPILPRIRAGRGIRNRVVARKNRGPNMCRQGKGEQISRPTAPLLACRPA